MGFYQGALKSEVRDGNPAIQKGRVKTRKLIAYTIPGREHDVVKLSNKACMFSHETGWNAKE